MQRGRKQDRGVVPAHDDRGGTDAKGEEESEGDAGVCHGAVPAVKKKLFLRIDTYLQIGSGLCSIYSLNLYIIRSVIISDDFHLDVTES